jgi:3'-phosphoadenosine 5'-phosphosulfate sulfotransferase (PAPS reductase)/FAD synthetase
MTVRAAITEATLKPWEHVISVSGVKDSTALYLLAVERGKPFRAVFADTQHEHEAVYEMIDALPRLTGGPEIQTVRADFTVDFERKRRFILAKWPEHGIPQALVERAAAHMRPSGSAFLDLCLIKGRFPGAKSRFCTDELKIRPMWQNVTRPILETGRTVISWQGVRAEESLARRDLLRFQRVNMCWGGEPVAVRRMAANWRSYTYRPIHHWKLADVWAMHQRHGIEPNRLYAMGMGRVGCLPCIMCKKDELRQIAAKFPEAIDKLEEWEALVGEAAKCGNATFFCATDDPLYAGETGADFDINKYGIRSRVEWSKTSRGGDQRDMLLQADFNTSCNTWGACE